MPPLASESKDYTRLFEVHGTDLRGTGTVDEAVGDCPSCDRPKFYVNVGTGQYSCKSCQVSGNALTYLKMIHEASSLRQTEAMPLARNRSLLSYKTLETWGVVHGAFTDEILVPGYNPAGVLSNLYRYVHDKKKDKHILYSSPGMYQQLFGVHLYDPKKPILWVAEGPWDAMVLWEILGRSKEVDGIITPRLTGGSMLKDINVIGVPGAGTWNDASSSSWSKLCEGKEVVLLYHSDHPRKERGVDILGAGMAGLLRVSSTLANHSTPPETIAYVKWGAETQHDTESPSGWDARDAIGRTNDLEGRVQCLTDLMQKFEECPQEWTVGKSLRATGGVHELTLVECDSWTDLVNQWHKAMTMSEGLVNGLAVMAATVISTLIVGEQLWFKMVSPPSTGKTRLCEAFTTNFKYCHAMSQLTGFHSGVSRSDRDNKVQADTSKSIKKPRQSLLGKIRGKTVFVKDSDPLIQNPMLPQIMAEFRDIYDGSSTAEYKNGVTRKETGTYTTFVLSGTETLRLLDDSDAGQRFLDFQIVEKVTDEMEVPIMRNMFKSMLRNGGKERTAEALTQDAPEMTLAKQMTGGYVKYLRENASELTDGVKIPDELEDDFIGMAQFVSYLRARPSDMQKEEFVQREMSGRVMLQLGKLARCLAAVMQKDVVDDSIMQIVRKVAVDTSRGDTQSIVTRMMQPDALKKGIDVETIRESTGIRPIRVTEMLSYLSKLGVVRRVNTEVTEVSQYGSFKTNKIFWQVAGSFRVLYAKVRGTSQWSPRK